MKIFSKLTDNESPAVDLLSGDIRAVGNVAAGAYTLYVEVSDDTGWYQKISIPVAPGFVNFDAVHLPKLTSGLKAVKDGIADLRIGVLGHSIPAGWRSTPGPISTLQEQYGNNIPQSYSSVFADTLSTALGIVVRTSAWFGDAAGSTSTSTSPSNNGATARYRSDPRIATYSIGAGHWRGVAGKRLGGNRLRNDASPNKVRFTDTLSVDTAEVFYEEVSTGGSFNVGADNGAAIGTATDVTGTDGTPAKKIVSLGVVGTHSIDAWRATGIFDLLGMIVYNSSIKQAIVVNAGKQGTKISDWLMPEQTAALSLIDTSVVFMQIDLNDWTTGVDPTLFKSDYQTWIDSMNSVGIEIVLVVSSTPNPATVTTYPWSQYRQAIYDLAHTNNVALIDFGLLINYDFANAQANGLLQTDNLHWLAAFHSLAGAHVAAKVAAITPT